MSLGEFLESLSSAKTHLNNSQREGLLAMREALVVFAELAERTGTEALGLPAHILRIMVATLDYFISLLPPDTTKRDHPDITAAKREALSGLIEALDAEIVRTAAAAETEADIAKIEALQSLIHYLETEMRALPVDGAAKGKRARVTKVTVE